MTDYYEILGVSKDAGKDEIKSAFRKKHEHSILMSTKLQMLMKNLKN